MLLFDIAMCLVICLLYTMCPFSVEGKLITWLFLLLSVNCLFVCLVSTSGRTYQLQAKDKQTMMFWLQELQVMVLTLFFSSWALSSLQCRVKNLCERFRTFKLNKRNGRWVVEKDFHGNFLVQCYKVSGMRSLCPAQGS